LKAWICFQDESGISQRPFVQRTWAPRGQTPVLRAPCSWKRISVSAALAYRWDGKRTSLYFDFTPGSYDANSLIAFLTKLHRHRRGRKTILIWDGLPAHKSRLMQSYLATQRHWLIVERLPAYAPDLNPVEPLWGNLKRKELANFCHEELRETVRIAKRGLQRIQHHRSLANAFLKHAKLFF